jgi:hypothetical protein
MEIQGPRCPRPYTTCVSSSGSRVRLYKAEVRWEQRIGGLYCKMVLVVRCGLLYRQMNLVGYISCFLSAETMT